MRITETKTTVTIGAFAKSIVSAHLQTAPGVTMGATPLGTDVVSIFRNDV